MSLSLVFTGCNKKFPLPGILSALIFLSACSGDGRPLEEAVEARNVDLNSLSVIVPEPLIAEPNENALPTIYENTGVEFRLRFEGRNRAGDTVLLPASGRRWTSSNPAAVSIDGNGNVRTLATGTSLIRIQIGGVASDFMQVSVQNSSLGAISEIAGDTEVDPCLPANYSAKGLFLDNTPRGLRSVEWSVSDPAFGSIRNLPNGRVELTGINAGSVGLIATVNEVSQQLAVTINDSLQSISIIPDTSGIEVGSTVNLAAQGLYQRDTGESSANISSSVVWSIPEDNSVVTRTNLDNRQIQLTGRAVGGTFVEASCGDITEQKTVIVVAAGSTSTNQLVFEQDNPLVISLSGGSVQLNVSTGSEYDSSNDVTDEAQWTIVSPETDIVALNSTTARGTVTPLRVGTVTIRASYSGNIRDIVVEVR